MSTDVWHLAEVRFPSIERIPIFGDIAISPHGIGIALGFVLGTWLFTRRVHKRGMARFYVADIDEAVGDIVVRAALGALIGARLLYVMQFPEVYAAAPWRILMVWEGGLTFLGGVTGAVLANVWMFRQRKWDNVMLFDSVAPGVMAGLMIGRLGDLFIGDHIGQPTDFALGWRCTGNYWQAATNSIGYVAPEPYPFDRLAAGFEGPTAGCFDVAVHQTALYDFGAATIVFLLILFAERRRLWDGATTAILVTGYGVLRFASDFAREDKAWFGLTYSQYVLIAAASAFWIYLLRRKPWTEERWAWDLEFDHPWKKQPDDGAAVDDEPAAGAVPTDDADVPESSEPSAREVTPS